MLHRCSGLLAHLLVGVAALLMPGGAAHAENFTLRFEGIVELAAPGNPSGLSAGDRVGAVILLPDDIEPDGQGNIQLTYCFGLFPRAVCALGAATLDLGALGSASGPFASIFNPAALMTGPRLVTVEGNVVGLELATRVFHLDGRFSRFEIRPGSFALSQLTSDLPRMGLMLPEDAALLEPVLSGSFELVEITPGPPNPFPERALIQSARPFTMRSCASATESRDELGAIQVRAQGSLRHPVSCDGGTTGEASLTFALASTRFDVAARAFTDLAGVPVPVPDDFFVPRVSAGAPIVFSVPDRIAFQLDAALTSDRGGSPSVELVRIEPDGAETTLLSLPTFIPPAEMSVGTLSRRGSLAPGRYRLDASVGVGIGDSRPEEAARGFELALSFDEARQDDRDGDSVFDVDDNCPDRPNPDQLDRGGLRTAAPDGVGDACQCGDVTGNGIVNLVDAAVAARAALGRAPGALLAPDLCPGERESGLACGREAALRIRLALITRRLELLAVCRATSP